MRLIFIINLSPEFKKINVLESWSLKISLKQIQGLLHIKPFFITKTFVKKIISM